MRIMPFVAAAMFAATDVICQETESEAPPPRPAENPPQPRARPGDVAPESVFSRSMFDQLAWRNLGPANPMGRMTDIEVHPQRQSTWFVGSAGGGVWKTENAGTTWSSVFDDATAVSIGDVAIAPSNQDIVWVGTGEETARNSGQWGDGVYKSADGGANWKHMGLRESFQIGHVEIHPTNPESVYVAVLGRLWGDNEERGVYRTRDGGASWERVLFLDAKTGCIDVRIHPQDPQVLFACMYERRRNGFDGNDPSVRLSPKSGLYKSVDGGDNWRQLTNGLPSCKWGRSGIDLMASRPDTMVAIIETERSGWARGDRKDRIASDPVEEPAAGQGPGQGQGRGARNTADLGIGREGTDGTEEAPGAVLTQVTEGGPAHSAKLVAGDRVTKVG